MLTEENLAMEITDTRAFKLCRAEILSPSTDWALSWKICHLKGLGSDITSFNFKLLHRLLVTKDRLHHLTPAVSPVCSFCSNANEDLEHALISCNYNNNVGNQLLSTVQNYLPEISGPALLRLELADLPEEVEFCLTFFTSSILMSIWEKRMSKSRISLFETRATLEAKCLLLRKTRFEGNVPILEEICCNL